MKKTIKTILMILCFLAVPVAGYVIYLLLTYRRVGDVPLAVDRKAETDIVHVGRAYTVTSYNVGFGAYQQDFTSALDRYYVRKKNRWKKIRGKNLKAFSERDAERNTGGAAGTIAGLHPDFALFQEADLDSDRCYHVNQIEIFQRALPGTCSVYCTNIHNPFLCYPLNDMMGRAEGGILSLSSVRIQKADRYEFASMDRLIERYFDLDRCFSAAYLNVDNGRQLVLINLHMSYYDKGGVVRIRQRKKLYGLIEKERKKGNYIIAGGDFNQDLLVDNPDYPQYTRDNRPFISKAAETQPDEVVFFFDEDSGAGLPEGFRVVASDNFPTCRPAAVAWKPGISHCCVFDGFIVSDNVEVLEHRNIVTATDAMEGFAFSDHEPVWMEFSLK